MKSRSAANSKRRWKAVASIGKGNTSRLLLVTKLPTAFVGLLGGGAYGRPGPREFLFASIAESFRSRCGSVRRPPECSKQGSPGATPHLGQGTERLSF